MFFSRLEQFQVVIFEFILIRFSNSGLFSCLVFLGVLMLVQYLAYRKMIPNKSQSVMESLFNFIKNLVQDQLGSSGWNMYGSFLLTLFLMILGSNLVGLMPYTFTVTSHMAMSLGCSIGIFMGSMIMGFWLHGESYFDMFLPMGVPLVLQRVLVYMEIIGFIAKAFSLGVSLSANMLAGHTLLKLTSMLVWGVFTSGGWMSLLTILPFFLLVLLTGLEMVIAFVQAYVFILLTCSVMPKNM